MYNICIYILFKITTLISYFEKQFSHVVIEIDVSTIYSLVETRHNFTDFFPKLERCRQRFKGEVWKKYYPPILTPWFHRILGSIIKWFIIHGTQIVDKILGFFVILLKDFALSFVQSKETSYLKWYSLLSNGLA